jgi:NAD(P)-dependent dehydrogenase (short-subunit alcohol dehydrogenase family)
MARDLEGKVLLVTGATEGIGKAACFEFARRGATLAIVGRTPEKTARVAGELEIERGRTAGDVDAGANEVTPIVADLSKIADVRMAAETFRAKFDRLDVLVNNAGAVFLTNDKSADGLEMTFALNHLGYFLLTTLVLDLLKKTPGARVVSTSSGAHRMGRFDIDDLARRESGASGFPVYGDSKLANILFTRELARRLEGSGVVANCFHPGFVESGFGKNNAGFMASMTALGASIFGRTPEKGAETLVWLATAPEAARFNGEYFQDKKIARVRRKAKDDALAAKLWALSEELCASC